MVTNYLKKLRILLLVMLAITVIAGCASPSVDKTKKPEAQPTTAAGVQAPTETKNELDCSPEETLVIAAKATPQGIDTSFHNSLESMQAFRNVMDTLTAFKVVKGENGEWTQDFTQVEGRLAQSWVISDEGRTITYKLKQGVLSQAGNELTADDVHWTFAREIGLKAIGSFFAQVVGRLETADSVKVIDRYTVSFTTSEPNPLGIIWATHSFNGIYDSVEAKKHITADDPWATEWLANNSAAFGPYKTGRWVSGQEVLFVAHAQYHGEKPKMRCILYKEVPNSANRLALLQTGAVDLAEQLTPKEITQLKGVSGVKIHNWPGNIISHFEMNVNTAPFDNKLVRQAMSYAFPYKAALESVYFGTARQATSVNPSTYPDFYGKETWNYTTDLDHAKSLLTQAGFEAGFTSTVYIDAGVPEHEQLAILMRTNLEKIGVTLNIEKLPTGDFYAKLLLGEFPMFVWQDMPGIPDGGFGIALWVVGGSAINHSNFNNAELNDLYKESASTLDQAVRSKNFKKIQEILIEEAPWVYVAETGWHIAARENIEGITWFPLQDIRWNYISK